MEVDQVRILLAMTRMALTEEHLVVQARWGITGTSMPLPRVLRTLGSWFLSLRV